MSKTSLLRLLLIIEAVILLVTAAYISIDYRDTWILQGLEAPFVVFVATYLVFMTVEKDVKWLLSFTFLARMVFQLIPVLKYQWFYGTAIDQHMHFRLAEDIYLSGHVPVGRLYSDTPLMHLLFASFSASSGVSFLNAFKLLPIFVWGLSPLIVYSMVKMLTPEGERGSIMKYALVLSSIPATSTLSFTVVGVLLGVFLVSVALLCLTTASSSRNRNIMVLVVAACFAIAAAHSYSSIVLAITVTITYLLSRLFKSFRIHMLDTSFVMFLLVIGISWLSQAAVHYGRMTHIVKVYLDVISGLSAPTFGTTGIRPRFFQLSWIDRIRSVLPLDGGDLALVSLSVLGVIIVVSKYRSWRQSRFLSAYLGSLWVFFFAQAIIGSFHVGVIEYNRIFEQTLPMAPILGAFTLSFFARRRYWGKPFAAIIIISAVLLCTIEIYSCQLVVPAASAFSPDLPSDEPILYINTVNSIYQRSMISHLSRYTPEGTPIACDRITQNQIFGLTQYDFSSSHVIYYYPFSRIIDESVKEKDYDLFLLHIPGKSGPFQEKAEIRTPSLINSAIQNSSVIYTNGESFILEPSVFFNETGR